MTSVRGKDLARLAFLLLVSAVGLVISTTLLMNPPHLASAPGYRWPLTTVVYDIICIAGILAVLFPIACSKVAGIHHSFEQPTEERPFRTATRVLGLLVVHGHHPPGSESTKHELLVGKRSFCATCYGLLTGAIVSLAFITVFSVTEWPRLMTIYSAYTLYFVGVTLVITGLLLPIVVDVGAKTRYVSAAVFVVGTGLMLLVTELLTEDLVADLFVVLLAVFWLISRISLSHRS